MRVWTVGIASISFALGACGDENADPVFDDTVSWVVGCGSGGCTSFEAHVQQAVKEKFKLSCSRDATGMSITLTDPGLAMGDGARPSSKLIFTRLNPETNSCTVVVQEASQVGFGAETWGGSCAGGGGNGSCTLTNAAFDTDGWQFSGQIQCTGLEVPNSANGVKRTLTAASGASGPVLIQVDNCD